MSQRRDKAFVAALVVLIDVFGGYRAFPHRFQLARRDEGELRPKPRQQ